MNEYGKPGLLFVSSITLEDSPDPSERKKWSRLAQAYRVHVLCFSKEGFGRSFRYDCQFHHLPKFLSLPLRLLLYYLLFPWLILYLTLRYGTNVWITQSPYEAGAALLPRLLLGIFTEPRLVVEAHGNWIQSLLELRNPPFRNLIRKLLILYSRLILWVADGYRSISRKTQDLLQKFGVANRPLVNFPTFTDLEIFLETSISDKESHETNRVLYAGALTELKGVDLLLKAHWKTLHSNPDLLLQICGRGSGENTFKKLTRELDIEDRVTFHGYLKQQKLKEKMLESKLVVLPSKTEGFGRVLIEGLACYTPFVATRTGGPSELAAESKAGIIVPVDEIGPLSEAILKLVDSKKTRREMGKQGHEYVEKNFSTEAYFKNYHQLVRSVRPESPSIN